MTTIVLSGTRKLGGRSTCGEPGDGAKTPVGTAGVVVVVPLVDAAVEVNGSEAVPFG